MGEYRGPARVRPFLRYTAAKYRAALNERSFRVYVTEQMRLNAQHKYLKNSWWGLMHPQRIEETRSGEEIAQDIYRRLEATKNGSA